MAAELKPRARRGIAVPQEFSDGDGGGFLEGSLVGVRDGVFEAAKAFGESCEPGPFSALESQKNFVEIAIAVFAAAESGLHFEVDRQRVKHVFDRLVQRGVGDGKESHKKHGGAFIVENGGGGEILTKKNPGKGGGGQFGGVSGGHGKDGKNGDPAAE